MLQGSSREWMVELASPSDEEGRGFSDLRQQLAAIGSRQLVAAE